MRLVVVTTLVWAGLTVGARATAAAQTAPSPTIKVAFISSQQILQQTPGYAAAESILSKEVQGYRDEFQKMQQQLDSAARAFDQQSIALTQAAKQTKQRDLQQMQQRLQQRSTELQDKAQQREKELLEPIRARVNGVIQGIRAEANYTLIFDADSPGNNIVAADPGLDITAKVIARLKQAK
jgi:outer membrane protein